MPGLQRSWGLDCRPEVPASDPRHGRTGPKGDPTQEVLDIDRFEDLQVCERAVPVLRHIARTLIGFEIDHP
jgi:hypothetical protein